MRKSVFTLASSLLMLLLSVSLVTAQGACAALVEQALDAVDTNCADLGRNVACYGYDLVAASFISPVEDDFFTLPADTADVFDIETLNTTPLNEDLNTWGVAVMNLQANVPNTLPGQNVTFIMFGDTEVENAVDPESAFEPIDGIPVTVATGANIRSGAGLTYNVVGGAVAGSDLNADGLSADGEWLRIVYREHPAWISRTVIRDDDAIDTLPLLTSDLHTPMQAFYLRTGIGEPSCEQAPGDYLVVQGPDGTDVELTINGLDVRIGSTVVFHNIEEDVMEAIVVDGKLTIPGAGPNGGDHITRRGQHSTFCLDEPDDRGLDGNSNDRIVTCVNPAQNYDLGQLCALEQTPLSLLFYAIDVPCPGDPAPTTSTVNTNPSQLDDVDCSTFSTNDPGRVAATNVTFSWTEAVGATDYELVFYDYQGNAVSPTYWTSNTSYTLNMGQVATGGEFQWEVRAFRDGAYACVTSRTQRAVRYADPNEPVGGYDPDQPVQPPPVSTRNFDPWLECLSTEQAKVHWTGALAGDTIYVEYYDYFGSMNTTSGSGASGFVQIYGYIGITGVYVYTSFDANKVYLGECYGATDLPE